ncbi:hypothetical protein FJTKL_09539 [Diaporthe vaccinii]|uniref:Phosphoglycerate mutase n=1 Tax=Diaporthe vaccinii TaxID=105482 RepID=A0ABR4FD29_9PEZI
MLSVGHGGVVWNLVALNLGYRGSADVVNAIIHEIPHLVMAINPQAGLGRPCLAPIQPPASAPEFSTPRKFLLLLRVPPPTLSPRLSPHHQNAVRGTTWMSKHSSTTTMMIGPLSIEPGVPVNVNWATLPCVKLRAASWIAIAVKFPHAWLSWTSAVRFGATRMALLSMAELARVPVWLCSRKTVR